MKQVARFIGKITQVNEPPEDSYALLKEDKPDSVAAKTTVDSAFVKRHKLQVNEEFEILILQNESGNYDAKVRRVAEQFEFKF